MMSRPIFFKIWGVGIGALGLWHIINWMQNADPNKDIFIAAVGAFCVIVGIIVVLMDWTKFDKRKDN